MVFRCLFRLFPLLVLFRIASAEQCNNMTSRSKLDDFFDCTGAKITVDDDKSPLDISSATQDQIDRLFNPQGLPKRELTSSLKMVQNTKGITKLEFKLEPYKTQSALIIDNFNLTDLLLSFNFIKDAFLELKIRGNRKLKKESLKNIKEYIRTHTTEFSPGTDIQDFGECRVNTPNSFGELEDCVYIDGDLNIGRIDYSSKFPTTLKNITGCLKIVDSNLTNVDFVKNLETNCAQANEIKNNSDLCLNTEELSNIKQSLNVTIDGNMKCNNTCSWKWALQVKDGLCHTIVDDVTITNYDDENKLDFLKSVVIIEGRLHIFDNKFTRFDFLPKLAIIRSTSADGALIHIHKNPNLEHFDFSALTSFEAPSSQDYRIIIEENHPNFTFTEAEYKNFVKIGGKHIRVSGEEKVLVQPINGTTTITLGQQGNATDDGNTGEKTEIEEDQMGMIIMTVLLGVAGFLMVGCISSCGALLYCHISIKKTIKYIERQEMKAGTMDVLGMLSAPREPPPAEVLHMKLREEERKMKEKGKNGKVVEGYVHSYELREIFQPLTEEERLFLYKCSLIMQKETMEQNVGIMHNIGFNKNELKFVYGGFDFEKAKQHGERMLTPQHKSRLYPGFVGRMMFTYKFITHEWPIKPGESVAECKSIDEYLQICFQTDDVNYGELIPDQGVDMILKFCEGFDYSGDNTNLISVTGPVNIVGETRGFVPDLLAVLSMDIAEKAAPLGIHPALYYKYIFTGNYLNGFNDVHLILFLLVLAKRQFPKIALLRGQYEFFKAEQYEKNLKKRFPSAWSQIDIRIKKCLKALPVAALVNNNAFVVCGGISDMLVKRDEEYTLMDLRDEMGEPGDMNERSNRTIADMVSATPGLIAHPRSLKKYGCFYNSRSIDSFHSQFKTNFLVCGAGGFSGMYLDGKLFNVRCYADERFFEKGLKQAVIEDKFFTDIERADPGCLLRVEANGSLLHVILQHSWPHSALFKYKESIHEECMEYQKEHPKHDNLGAKQKEEEIVKNCRLGK